MAAAAEAVAVSCRCGYKWLARFKAEGMQGLDDRSSRHWSRGEHGELGPAQRSIPEHGGASCPFLAPKNRVGSVSGFQNGPRGDSVRGG